MAILLIVILCTVWLVVWSCLAIQSEHQDDD